MAKAGGGSPGSGWQEEPGSVAYEFSQDKLVVNH